MGGHQAKELKLIKLLDHCDKNQPITPQQSKAIGKAWKTMRKYVVKAKPGSVLPHFLHHLYYNAVGKDDYQLWCELYVADDYEPLHNAYDMDKRQKVFRDALEWLILHHGETSFKNFFEHPSSRREGLQMWPPHSKQYAKVVAAEQEKQRLLTLFKKVSLEDLENPKKIKIYYLLFGKPDLPSSSSFLLFLPLAHNLRQIKMVMAI
jgi:hypothetical protein